MFILHDHENAQFVGPFESDEAALAWATLNEWGSMDGDRGGAGWSVEPLDAPEPADWEEEEAE